MPELSRGGGLPERTGRGACGVFAPDPLPPASAQAEGALAPQRRPLLLQERHQPDGRRDRVPEEAAAGAHLRQPGRPRRWLRRHPADGRVHGARQGGPAAWERAVLPHQGTGCPRACSDARRRPQIPSRPGRPSVTMRLQMCREPQPLALSIGGRGRHASRISGTFPALMPASHPISSLMPVSQDPRAALYPTVRGHRRRHLVLCARPFFPVLKIMHPLSR